MGPNFGPVAGAVLSAGCGARRERGQSQLGALPSPSMRRGIVRTYGC